MLAKNIFRVALVTGSILMIHLVAMLFTDEVNWTIFDFLVMGALLFSIGLAYVLIALQSNKLVYRAAVALALGTMLLLAWVNLAVGIIGSGPNIGNIMYIGVFAVGFLGSIMARLRAEGMMRTLFAMAGAQMLVPVITFFVERQLVTEPPGVLSVFALNAFFAIFFAGAALLFKNASDSKSVQNHQAE